MKSLIQHINEVLVKHNLKNTKIKPKTKEELQQIIIDRIKSKGPECDLNDIDVSGITYMGGLFNADKHKIFKNFNCVISEWDVSNVVDMHFMFWGCKKFNQDLSDWDVSTVKNMYGMFFNCKEFNGDISGWDVSKVVDMDGMFYNCEKFNCDISKWDVSKVVDMESMFKGCLKFNQDISTWNISNVPFSMFEDCPIKKQYMPKFK